MPAKPLFIIVCCGEHEKLHMAVMLASVAAISGRSAEVFISMNAMRNAATNNIIERAAIFIEQMVNNLANEEVAALAGVAQDVLHEAVAESATAKHKGGLFATIGMLSNPEIQASRDFLLTFAKKLRERV